LTNLPKETMVQVLHHKISDGLLEGPTAGTERRSHLVYVTTAIPPQRTSRLFSLL
jgi:hypothetical protein